MHVYLKIKLKTLATEAKDIRREERKININARERTRIKRDIRFGNTIVHYLKDDGTVNSDRSINLTEAQLIRLQKKLERSRNILNNTNAQTRLNGLRKHRTNDVRKEARSSLIAYGFLRGLDYKQIENTTLKVDWDRVEAMVKKYSEDDPRVTLQKFAEWVAASGKAPKA